MNFNLIGLDEEEDNARPTGAYARREENRSLMEDASPIGGHAPSLSFNNNDERGPTNVYSRHGRDRTSLNGDLSYQYGNNSRARTIGGPQTIEETEDKYAKFHTSGQYASNVNDLGGNVNENGFIFDSTIDPDEQIDAEYREAKRAREAEKRRRVKSHGGQEPYLGVGSKIVRSLFNQTNITFIITLYTIIYLKKQIDSLTSDTKSALSSTCAGMEAAATSMGSASFYAAKGTNALIESSSTQAYTGMVKGLEIAIALSKAIVIFIIERYQKLLLCLINAFILLGKDLISENMQDITSFITKTTSTLSSEVDEKLSVINDQLNNSKLSNVVSAINNFFDQTFNGKIDLTTNDLFNTDVFSNLPNTITSSLEDFADHIPTLDDYFALVEKTVSLPFDALSSYLNETLGNVVVNSSDFMISAKKADVTSLDLCSNVDYSWVDNVGEALMAGLVIAIGIVALAFFLVVSFSIAQSIYDQWQLERRIKQISVMIKDYDLLDRNPGDTSTRRPVTPGLKQQKEVNEKEIDRTNEDDNNAFYGYIDTMGKENFDSYDQAENIVHAAGNPFAWKLGVKFGYLFNTKRNQNRARWLMNFLSHPASIVCIFAGIVGMICIAIQLHFIELIRENAGSTSQVATYQMSSMAVAVVDTSRAAAIPYVNTVNGAMLDAETKFNSKVGVWVINTIDTVNDTMNSITDVAEGVFDKVLGAETGSNIIKSSLRKVVDNWIYCVVGGTVEKIEDTLTFMKNKALVKFPRVTTDDIVGFSQQDAEDMLDVVAINMYKSINRKSDNSTDSTTTSTSSLTKRAEVATTSGNGTDSTSGASSDSAEDSITADSLLALEFDKILTSYSKTVKSSEIVFLVLIIVGLFVPAFGLLMVAFWILEDFYNSKYIMRFRRYMYGSTIKFRPKVRLWYGNHEPDVDLSSDPESPSVYTPPKTTQYNNDPSSNFASPIQPTSFLTNMRTMDVGADRTGTTNSSGSTATTMAQPALPASPMSPISTGASAFRPSTADLLGDIGAAPPVMKPSQVEIQRQRTLELQRQIQHQQELIREQIQLQSGTSDGYTMSRAPTVSMVSPASRGASRAQSTANSLYQQQGTSEELYANYPPTSGLTMSPAAAATLKRQQQYGNNNNGNW